MTRLSITSGSDLTVDGGNGRRFAIHPIWLRERCRDASSLDARTGQRLHDPADLPLDLTLTEVTPTGPGQYRLRFSDGHVSEFVASDILREFALSPGDHDCPPLRLWDATLPTLPRTHWVARGAALGAATGDTAWLEAFLSFGFVIFDGVPTTPGTVLEVASACGFTRVTNFGTLFDVRSTPEATDLAYTSLALDPHTDNPYRDPVPGVQLLHCLVNETTGGLSTLVDGFAVAERLRQADPAAFSVLSHTAVRFKYRDADTELTHSAAPIDLDVTGAVRAIHFSPRLDFVPLLPPLELTAYYRARRVFDRLLRSSEFELRFLLNAGDLVMFDNRRLLHGRTGFDLSEGLRHLQGCYIDIDAPRSRYRRSRRNAPGREQ